MPMAQGTEIYVLRHCLPAESDLPNRERPLGEVGRRQARELVPILAGLGLSAVYTSPFRRAIETVAPFCEDMHIDPILKEELIESAEDEKLPQVRSRMIGLLSSVTRAHSGERVLVCTHGGCLWAVISEFDSAFGYEDYRQIGCPDVRRVIYTGGVARLDEEFRLLLPIP